MTSEDNNTSSKSKSLLFYYTKTLVLKKSLTNSLYQDFKSYLLSPHLFFLLHPQQQSSQIRMA
jgi:hypothetical protein